MKLSIFAAYVQSDGLGCCIAPSGLHRFCSIRGITKGLCEKTCNLDSQCKGFFYHLKDLHTYIDEGTTCYIATAKDCGIGWRGRGNPNHVEDIKNEDTCAAPAYSACFIKHQCK